MMKVRTDNHKAFDKSIGIRLARKRVNNTDLSQTDVCDLIERSHAYVCLMENGHYSLSLYDTAKLCKIYKISLDDLIKGVEL